VDTARPIPGPHRHLRRAIPANPDLIPPMPRPAPLMPPAAFPAFPEPFAFTAEKKWSRMTLLMRRTLPAGPVITPETIP
jgi:hypothetical protein